MRYRRFLSGLHERLAPPTYLEIGVRTGGSLVLATPPAVGIDPDPALQVELGEGRLLFEETSDEYFARPQPLEPFGGASIAMGFIDGMHHVEFVLRDFINVERHADWSSVVVFDDILPRNATEALRKRETRAWTGDVFKILGILERHRPDLICLRVGTEPTGLLVVLGLDPSSTVLADRYDDIVADVVTPDPQALTRDVRDRRWVLEPERVLGASLWSFLHDARARGTARADGLAELRRVVRRDLGRVGPNRIQRMLRPLPLPV